MNRPASLLAIYSDCFSNLVHSQISNILIDRIKITIYLLVSVFLTSGPAGVSAYSVAENNSYRTTCAEEDNINISHHSYSNTTPNFEIKATHPEYLDSSVPDNCAADFSGCTNNQISTSALLRTDNLSCQKIYDDGINVFSLCIEQSWWRPYLMTVKVNGNNYQGHRLVLNKKIDDAQSYPEVLVLYEDGNLRSKPHPPQGRPDVCFGSSVIIGPVNDEKSKRPYVDISEVSIEPETPCLDITYLGGEKSYICLSVNRSEAHVRVHPEYGTAKPFAVFRSMWIEDGNADVDHLEWSGGNIPILSQWNTLDGMVWYFHRETESKHNTSAPDITVALTARLVNLSSRGWTGTGDNVMIAGLVISGGSPKQVLVRAIGPTLASAGVPNPLNDPTLTLYNSGGTVLTSNDNWQDSQAAAIQATGKAPPDPHEAAILTTLNPGAYTAILRGINGTTGNALVEVYEQP